MIPDYPQASEFTLAMRRILHPLFQELPDGISEFTFASILPEQYNTINREQDLGNEGLRKTKLSYKPVGFVKKYRVKSPGALFC